MAEPDNDARDTSLSGMLSKFMEKFDNLQYYEKSEDILPSEAEQRCIAGNHNRNRQINCHMKGHVRNDCLLLKKGNDHGMDKLSVLVYNVNTIVVTVSRHDVTLAVCGDANWIE